MFEAVSGPLSALPDLLRALSVPIFLWAAKRDVETRRVPNETWLPLLTLGTVALAIDAGFALSGPAIERTEFLLGLAVSLGVLVPLAVAFWWFGGFGGADAKAIAVLAVSFPVVPTYTIAGTTVPVLEPATLAVFSLTVLTNGALLGAVYPIALAARNALAGQFSLSMAIGRPVRAAETTERHGRLLARANGLERGVDLDALRIYLRWRKTALRELRATPAHHRDPSSLPEEFASTGDGAIDGTRIESSNALGSVGEVEPSDSPGGVEHDEPDEYGDPWGADAFVAEVDGIYGTSAEGLRGALELLTREKVVWITPGIPFLLLLAAGLCLSFVYGDLLVGLFRVLGVV